MSDDDEAGFSLEEKDGSNDLELEDEFGFSLEEKDESSVPEVIDKDEPPADQDDGAAVPPGPASTFEAPEPEPAIVPPEPTWNPPISTAPSYSPSVSVQPTIQKSNSKPLILVVLLLVVGAVFITTFGSEDEGRSAADTVAQVPTAQPEKPKAKLFNQDKPIDPMLVATGGEALSSLAVENACSAGQASACWLRGYRFAMGIDSVPSLQLARIYYGKGCEKGHILACALTAQYLKRGTGGLAKDPDKGKSDLDILCGRHEMAACYWSTDKSTSQMMHRRYAASLETLCEESTDYGLYCLLAAVSVQRASGVKEDALEGETKRRYLKLLWSACRLGQGSACRNLADKEEWGELPEPLPFDLKKKKLLALGCIFGSAGSCFEMMKTGDMAKSEVNLRRTCLLGFSNLCAHAEGEKSVGYHPVFLPDDQGQWRPVYIDRKEISIGQAYAVLKSYQGETYSARQLKRMRAHKKTALLQPRQVKQICTERGGRMLTTEEWSALIKLGAELEVALPDEAKVKNGCMANDLIFGLCDLHSNRPEWVVRAGTAKALLAGWHPSESIPSYNREGEGVGIRSFDAYCQGRLGEHGDQSFCSDTDGLDLLNWSEAGGRCAFEFGPIAPAATVSVIFER